MLFELDSFKRSLPNDELILLQNSVVASRRHVTVELTNKRRSGKTRIPNNVQD